MAQSFRLRESFAEGGPTIQPFVIGATVVAVGDLVKLSSGKVVAATSPASGPGNIVGLVMGPADYRTQMDDLTINVSKVLVTTDPDIVFAADDATERFQGDTLDITGTTGGMSLTTDSDSDVMVTAYSTATQETLFRIAPDSHFTAVS